MPATFILSLDCEGKWGVADGLNAEQHRTLTDERLRLAYHLIVGLLDEYRLEATFAFVGAFSQSGEALARIRPKLERLKEWAPGYIGAALDDMATGSREGWHGDWAVETVLGAATAHEVALHGVSHIPWTWADRSLADADLALLKDLDGPIRNSRTFVYPRNLVAHTDVLAAAGFDGYRAARPARSRAASLLSEFNIFEKPETRATGGAPQAIPAGFFVNWRHGLRRVVPPSVSAFRARRLIDRAERSSTVVHYWLHPENVAAEPDTLEILRKIVREVADRRDAGRCEVLTQVKYCERTSAAGR